MARERSKNREETQEVEPQHRSQMSRWDPWPSFGAFSTMRRWFDDMDRVFEDFGFPTLGRFRHWTASEASFFPHIDVFERDGKLVISADLPGLNKDDVKVDVTEDAVIIEGERKYEHEKHEEGVYRSERSYGQFRRQIPLPQGVKTETATANFKNGVLEITVEAPQFSESRRRIQVQGEETEKVA